MTVPEKNSKNWLQYPPTTPEQRLIWEILFLFVMIVTVGLLGQLASTDVLYTIIITTIFGINLSIRFILINERGDWLFFLLGVLAGGGNDLMSMITGIYSYSSITILPILNGLLPLWMILFWGQIFLLFRKVFHLKWFRGDEFQKTKPGLSGWVNKQLVIDLIVFACLRIAIYNTYMDPLLPSVFYAGIILIRIILFRPKKNELLIIAILPYAFLFEGLMVTFGLYVYINPTFLGMPAWLFLWWIFLVPLLLKEIFDRLEFYMKKKEK